MPNLLPESHIRRVVREANYILVIVIITFKNSGLDVDIKHFFEKKNNRSNIGHKKKQ